MEKVRINFSGDDDRPEGLGVYVAEVDSSGLTVYGCDCADIMDDLDKLARLRSALDRLIAEKTAKL